MSHFPTAAPAQSTLSDQHNSQTGLSIVSALVNGVQVPIACPAAWCEMDHAGSDATRHVEDIDHSSANVDAYVPDFHGGPDQLFAYAHIGQDTYSNDTLMRAPHVRVEDRGGEGSYLTPDQADAFAANLTAFALQIRALAKAARGESASGRALHHDAAQLLGQCLQRRRGRDPLTGDRLDGQPEPDEAERDRLPCTEGIGHDGDHRDFLGRTWTKEAA